jgi:hypothetical protein
MEPQTAPLFPRAPAFTFLIQAAPPFFKKKTTAITEHTEERREKTAGTPFLRDLCALCGELFFIFPLISK